jgi:hypothetical protein
VRTFYYKLPAPPEVGKTYVTFRRGDKWKDTPAGEEIEIKDNKTEELIARGEVVDTKYQPFINTKKGIFKLAIDPATRDYQAMKQRMQFVYPGFESVEDVTILFYKVTEVAG